MPCWCPGRCLAPGRAATRSRWPLHAWEPVIYHGGHQLDTGQRRADSFVCGVGPVDTLPGRVIGAKPAPVCRWIFTLLGAAPGDILDDLFPGSGAVSRAWAAYTGQQPSSASASHASCKAQADASSPAGSDSSEWLPADDSVTPWSSSPSPDLFPATCPRPVLSQAPSPRTR